MPTGTTDPGQKQKLRLDKTSDGGITLLKLAGTIDEQFEGKKNPAPFYFIGSEHDVDLEGFHGEDPLGQLKNQYSDLRAVEMIGHAGHMVQMERPQETNALIVKFLGMIREG